MICPHVSPRISIINASVTSVTILICVIKLSTFVKSVSSLLYVFVSVVSYINFTVNDACMQFLFRFFFFCFYSRFFFGFVVSYAVINSVVGRSRPLKPTTGLTNSTG